MFNKNIDTESIGKNIWNDLQKTSGNNILSLIVYGPNQSGQYLNSKTENNILVITQQLTGPDLTSISLLQKQWARKYNVYPLFLTKHDILTSADIFPIEFLNIKESYKIIGGEDIFSNIDIPIIHLRAQCEHSIKGKLIILRQGYLEKPETARELIINSFPALFLVFKNILKLLGDSVSGRDDVINALCARTNGDKTILNTIADIAYGKTKCGRQECVSHFNNYLAEWQKVADFVDQLDVA
ncbi:MAG: hypothetical protein ABIH39_02050 [Candidatus Margulisiibacteriota bacterium]